MRGNGSCSLVILNDEKFSVNGGWELRKAGLPGEIRQERKLSVEGQLVNLGVCPRFYACRPGFQTACLAEGAGR